MGSTDRSPAIMLLIGSGGLLAGAYGFQYFGDLQPCVLCLYQRVPHAVVIVLALAAIALSPRPVVGWIIAAVGLAVAIGAGIAGFHVGVEQHWWEGTAECGSTAAADTIEALRAQLLAQPVTRCDEVPWSLFNVSMAGYNFAFSTALAIFAFRHSWSLIRRSTRDGAAS